MPTTSRRPHINDPASVQAGAKAFAEHGCANCHGGPGVDWAKFSEGLHPDPPDLKDVVGELSPAQLFWVVKNGINMTGMPSFAEAGTKDDEIWSIVAFLKKLPGVSEADYKAWTAHAHPARRKSDRFRLRPARRNDDDAGDAGKNCRIGVTEVRRDADGKEGQHIDRGRSANAERKGARGRLTPPPANPHTRMQTSHAPARNSSVGLSRSCRETSAAKAGRPANTVSIGCATSATHMVRLSPARKFT